ncbi:cytoplasmic tRNA 2-thiolation protein 1 [Diorhabda sublineata]|uniref:cytoplasmic tRNA 2-thiolation protein 1 n=1 Tax=Diorhabda sublineata TaxID=1163346 RepID=UPI0024E09065|nr:cytoplasmic tRNA 2-thiolation protein 1 [Diorhabda sublineata]
MLTCSAKCGKKAVLKRPKTGDVLCRECFFEAFENEIHFTITKAKLFKPNTTVAIAASGGKDSTVLAHVMKTLNEKFNYGLNLVLLSIDEGITGYRDDSLETVKQNRDDYGMPLKIMSYKDLYGWTMDEIVAEIGKKNNCTFCGVFRRQALDRGANLLKVNYLATGHNADDIAETILMNILRGDLARLNRCTSIITDNGDGIPRVKPLKYCFEKEIVMYAHFKKLVYFSTECVFAPNAYRGHARVLLKDLEKIDPTVIMNIIHSGETIKVNTTANMPKLTNCTRCGYVSSQEICKACILLEGLNKGLPRLGVGKSSKVRRILKEHENKGISTGTNQENCVDREDKKCLCSGKQDLKQINIERIVLEDLK